MRVDDISEDDLDTFEGFLRYHAFDPAKATSEEVAAFRTMFEDAQTAKAASPKLGSMKLSALRSGESRYAVAVRHGGELLLTLWIRRDPKGDVYVMVPRGRGDWNPHASYHRDGSIHHKSFDYKMASATRQSLTQSFKGCEHLGTFGGHFPNSVGTACDTGMFSDVVEVPAGLLGPKNGFVSVDLLEPGAEPHDLMSPIFSTHTFKEKEPWLMIRVGTQARPDGDDTGSQNEPK